MTPIKIIPVIVLLGKLITQMFSQDGEELSSSSNQCGFSAALLPSSTEFIDGVQVDTGPLFIQALSSMMSKFKIT